MTTTVQQAGTERPGYLRPDPLLDVRDLHCSFTTPKGTVHAVRGVTFDVRAGETLGLVGESGCGKTTTGRAILQLPPADSGTVTFDGQDLGTLGRTQLRAVRRKLQMIFQDPLSSFNPRRKVIDIVGEGLRIAGVPGPESASRVADALEQVGMSADAVAGRRPHQFSGGQCQRISIARALALGPQLIVCDEPVASLDVSVQAQVLNVLRDVKERNRLALVFVSHDLAVVRNVSDRVAVMHRGRIVEIGDATRIYSGPVHPYTARLLDAVPVIDAARSPVDRSSVADLGDWRDVDRELVRIDDDHHAAVGPVTGGGEAG